MPIHSNGSQFFITLRGCEWMNNGFVGVGRVIQGYNSLRLLNSIVTTNQKPSKLIVIDDCGLEVK